MITRVSAWALALSLCFLGALQASTSNAESYLDTETPEALFESINQIQEEQGKAYADRVRTGVLFFLSKGLADEAVSNALRSQTGQVTAVESAQSTTLAMLSKVPLDTLVTYAEENEPRLLREIREFAQVNLEELTAQKARGALATELFNGFQASVSKVRIHTDRFGYRIPELHLILSNDGARRIRHVDFEVYLESGMGGISDIYSRELMLDRDSDGVAHWFDLNPLSLISVQLLREEALADQLELTVNAIYARTSDGTPVRVTPDDAWTDADQRKLERMKSLTRAETLLSAYEN